MEVSGRLEGMTETEGRERRRGEEVFERKMEKGKSRGLCKEGKDKEE